MPKRKAPVTAKSWLADAEEVPRPNVESTKRMERTSRRYKILIWTAVIVGIAGTFGGIAASQRVSTPVAAAAQPTIDAPGKAIATTALINWLKSDPAPLPGGKMLEWDGAVQQKIPTIRDSSGKPVPISYKAYLQKYTVTDTAGNLYEADVQVFVDKTLGAAVQGTPSLIPIAPSDGSAIKNTSTWPGYTSVTPPSGLTPAIQAWATAFTSGNPDTLRLNVGDPNSRDSYMPLSGVSSVAASISDSAYVLPAGSTATTSSRMFVRVGLQITWDNQSSSTSSSTQEPTVTYDLLVEKAGTASPQVVSWGPAGTGPDLTPYSVAVRGLNVTTPNPATTPAPTSSPSNGDSSGN